LKQIPFRFENVVMATEPKRTVFPYI